MVKPTTDGAIRMPQVDGAMTKVSPRFSVDDKGTKALSVTKSSKAEAKEKLMTRIRKRMERVVSAESENRKAGLEDRKFKKGDQWPSEIVAQRNLDKRPCLTINKLPTFVHQITNDQRQNRPSIVVSPVGDRGDVKVAKMYRGLIRHIERSCAADIAYDTAFDDAVTMGWGYWRILTEWEAPDSMNLVLAIHRVRNPFTVYLDPSHQDPTGADAKWGFITDMIPREEFEEKYPDADPMPYTDGGIGETYKNWVNKDEVRIAEYFEIEYRTRTLVELDTGHTGWEDELDDLVKQRIKNGTIQVLDERESRVPKVMWYKVTAKDVLMEREWIGSSIPIVKVIGEEIDVEGKVTYSGVIRNAKDPQRQYNYWSPLALDTPLPTPDGWTTMGEVEAGDRLLDEHGKPCTVVGTSPVHLFRDCFRVEFDDGTHIIADGKHPWEVEERGIRRSGAWLWSIRIATTNELTPNKHFIYVADPLDLPDADLPIEPYMLGAWLGDGSAAEPRIWAGDADMDEMRANLQAAGSRLSNVQKTPGKVGVFTVYGVRKHFTALGLLGNKHIPEQYLRASRAQRLALLQGLMDTDGSIAKNNQCSLTTTLPSLAVGFAELLRTLGIKAVSCKRPAAARMMPGGYISECSPSEQFSFTAPPDIQVFRLGRKHAIQSAARPTHARRTKRHRIVSVTPVPSVPVKCVRIDTPTHLFLAGTGMVPTHNTSETEMVALAPKAPFIGEEGQFEGHEDEWKAANIRSMPYLSYKGTSVAGHPIPPPQRQPFSGSPGGIVQAKMGAAQDMMATTGIRFDATMNERVMDESGKAIRELRRAGDIGSFHFVDNLARSLRRTGEILVEAIPLVYSEPRTITILREDDKEEQVRIDPNMPKAAGELRRPDGKTMTAFNPTYGKYGVTVTIGPSFATKRIEASENMIQFARALPQTAALIADLIAKNQDWPGAEEIAARLAKTLPPNLLQPDMKDVPPQIQAVLQAQDAQIKDLGQKLQQAMLALNDKQADRAVLMEQIGRDFEAKLLKIAADTETKIAAIEQKADMHHQTQIGERVQQLGENVASLIQTLDQAGGGTPPANDVTRPQANAGPPPEAMRHLKEGRVTTFANGSKWTLKNGQPTQVA